MAGLEARARRGAEGEMEKVSVEKHIAEGPLLVLRAQLSNYHSFRAAPRERVSINDAIETLRINGKKFGWHFHETPTFEEQRQVIHALAYARDIAHVHDSAPKILVQLDEIDATVTAKNLHKDVEDDRLENTDAIRRHLLLNVHVAEKSSLTRVFATAEKLIEQAKKEKKMQLVNNLQTLIASLLLSQKYYVATLKQFIEVKEEIDRVAQRLSYDEIIRESKKFRINRPQ